jgi:enoyl-CoA hydratase/carnithine racemase
MTVMLNRPDKKNAIHLELLFELNSLLNWCMNHIEVKSIIIKSTTSKFSQGLDAEHLKKLKSKHVEKIVESLYQVQLTCLKLPQTIILDYQEGASNIGIELGLVSDFKLAHVNAKFNANHFELGIPLFSTSSILRNLCSFNGIRKLFMGNQMKGARELQQAQVLTELYDSSNGKDIITKYLRSTENSNVARIQSKLLLNRLLIREIEDNFELDYNIIRGALSLEDWSKLKQNAKPSEKTPFLEPKATRKKVKMTLIQGGPEA